MFLETYSFILMSNFFCIYYSQYSLFGISAVSVFSHLSHFLKFSLHPLSFLLGEPDQRFVNFVYFFKEPALGFIDFFLLIFFIIYFYQLEANYFTILQWFLSYIDVNIHVFPIPILPPTSLSTRSLWVFPVHQARALVSCILPGLVICFTLDNIHFSMLFSQNIPSSPSPTESKSLFCTSMSLFLCFIYCLSDLYYFLPSTDFRFCLFFFFLILLGGRLGCLFEFCFSFFFFFFEEDMYHYVSH